MTTRLQLKTVAVLEEGCFSVLLWDGRPFAVSVERTFSADRPVITNGVFSCKKSWYNKGQYPTYEIEGPGHSRIMFHKGNKDTDSLGCVVVTESFGLLSGTAAVLDSAHGFAELIQLTHGLESFEMEVSGR